MKKMLSVICLLPLFMEVSAHASIYKIEAREKVLSRKNSTVGSCERVPVGGGYDAYRLLWKSVAKKMIYLVRVEQSTRSEALINNSIQFIDATSTQDETWSAGDATYNFRSCEAYREKMVF